MAIDNIEAQATATFGTDEGVTETVSSNTESVTVDQNPSAAFDTVNQTSASWEDTSGQTQTGLSNEVTVSVDPSMQIGGSASGGLDIGLEPIISGTPSLIADPTLNFDLSGSVAIDVPAPISNAIPVGNNSLTTQAEASFTDTGGQSQTVSSNTVALPVDESAQTGGGASGGLDIGLEPILSGTPSVIADPTLNFDLSGSVAIDVPAPISNAIPVGNNILTTQAEASFEGAGGQTQTVSSNVVAMDRLDVAGIQNSDNPNAAANLASQGVANGETAKTLIDAVANGATLNDIGQDGIDTIARFFGTDEGRASLVATSGDGNPVKSTEVDANSDSAKLTDGEAELAAKQANARETSVFGNEGVSDVSAPLINDKTPRNADGSVDTAVTFVIDPTKYKVWVGGGYADTRKTFSSAPGDPNPFGKDGAESVTYAGSTVKTIAKDGKRILDAITTPQGFEKVVDVMDWLTAIPSAGLKKWADPPSVTTSTFNDAEKQAKTPAPISGSLGTWGVTQYLPGVKVLGSVSAGGGAGSNGAPFFDSSGVSVSGSASFSVDGGTAAAEALRRGGLGNIGGVLQAVTNVGLQGRAGVSVPILSIKDIDKPGVEWELPGGKKITNPVKEIDREIENDKAGKTENTATVRSPGERPYNFGDKRVAEYNTEFQLATGTKVWDLPPVSRNPSTGKLDNNGSESLALANQFYDVLQAYGGLKKGEKITSGVDFNNRVTNTVNKLYDRGRSDDAAKMMQKLANPYGVNAGNSALAVENKNYKGPKAESSTAQHVRDVFAGKYAPKAAIR
jgi:hypothetical protein